MGNWKIENLKIWKFQINGLKKFLTLVVIFSNTPKKQNLLDDCKVKIFENYGEFDILTKDLVWNIEKWASKKCKI